MENCRQRHSRGHCDVVEPLKSMWVVAVVAVVHRSDESRDGRSTNKLMHMHVMIIAYLSVPMSSGGQGVTFVNLKHLSSGQGNKYNNTRPPWTSLLRNFTPHQVLHYQETPGLSFGCKGAGAANDYFTCLPIIRLPAISKATQLNFDHDSGTDLRS